MIAQSVRHVSCLATLMLTAPLAPALAQSQSISEDARRFLVYPPNRIQTFQENDGYFYLHYYGASIDKGHDRKSNRIIYNQVIQVTRYPDEAQSVAACEQAIAVPIAGKKIRRIDGFSCAFVQESVDGFGTVFYRSSWYAWGRYFATLGETAEPYSMLPASPPVEPLLAALAGRDPAAPMVDLRAPAAPASTPAAQSSVRIDGNTIHVTDAAGKQYVVTLMPARRAEIPPFTPVTVGDEAKAAERFIMRHLYEASYSHLSPDLRKTFVNALPMPSDVTAAMAGSAARAALDAAESGANWARNNPADVALLGLSVAVGVAFPVSAFANPALATGGAAVLRGVVGTAMVAGTTGFVSKLASDFVSDKGALQRVKEAGARAIGDAAASVPGSLAGAGVEAAIGQGLAKAAVTAGSITVGIAVDKVMEKAQLSQTMAEVALKAPSFAANLLTPASGTPSPGGISLNFDR